MLKKLTKLPLPSSRTQVRARRRSNKAVLIPGVVCALFMLSATPVYAYIDPGTGSMLVQAIAAGVLTAGAMVGVFWRTIKNFFLNMGNKNKKDAAKNKGPAGSKQNKKTGGRRN